MQYVPEWFPGADWKRKVPVYRRCLHRMVNEPYEWAKGQMVFYFCSILPLLISQSVDYIALLQAAGTARPSFLSTHLHDQGMTPEQARTVKWAAAGVYSGLPSFPSLKYLLRNIHSLAKIMQNYRRRRHSQLPARSSYNMLLLIVVICCDRQWPGSNVFSSR